MGAGRCKEFRRNGQEKKRSRKRFFPSSDLSGWQTRCHRPAENNLLTWTAFVPLPRVNCADMGLTIHYTLSMKTGTPFRFLHTLLKSTARRARKNGCAHVGKILHSTEIDPTAPPFFETHPGHDRRLHGGSGTHGWALEVWPGEGCETAVFGILRERREIPSKRRKAPWPPRYQTRWRLDAFCKTQYAAMYGWEHFLKCHLRVIHLLDYWRAMGARVEVYDEGGYWKSRSEEKLRQGCSLSLVPQIMV
jgi:hypothetical protein